MARNDRTPAGQGEGSGKGVVLAADPFQIAPPRSEIQKFHLRNRFGLSPSTAAAVAALAYDVPETWRRA